MSWFARGAALLLGAVEPLVGAGGWLPTQRLRLMVDGGEPERAILYGWRLLAERPHDPWLHHHVGRAAQAKSLYAQARVRYAHAAALAPAEPTFRFALGYALRREGRLDAAAREYRVALAAAPDEPKILFNLGVVERERRRYRTAQGCFQRVVAQRPRDVRALYTLGVTAFEGGDLETSSEVLTRALQREPKHYKARYQLGLVHLEAGRRDEGRDALRQALTVRKDYGPAHYALGRSLAEDDPARGRHHLRESLLAQPPMLRAHLDLGRLHQRAGRLAEARAEYLLYRRHFPDKRRDWIAARLAELERQLGRG